MTAATETTQTEGPDSVQVVRWRGKPRPLVGAGTLAGNLGRWSYGRWSGERGPDGSLTIYESRTQSEARHGLRSERVRAVRPELVEVHVSGSHWSPVTTQVASVKLVELDKRESIADVTTAPSVEPSSRDGRSRQASLFDDIRSDLLDNWLRDVAWRVDSLAVVNPVVDPFTHCLHELAAYASVMTWSGWSPDPVGTASGAELVAALEAARNGVRAQFPELLDAVMITGSGLSSRGVTWGHFRREAWRDALASGRRPEIFIGAERLATGAVLTMQTILHEAAHELAFVRDVQDTSRQHRYHNAHFRDIAQELGLTYPDDRPAEDLGFSAVVLTEAGKRRWRDEIAALHAAVTLMGDDPTRWLGGGSTVGLGGHGVALPPGRRGPRKGGASYIRVECECDVPRIIRVSASTLALGAITCNVCEMEFT